MVSRAPLVAVGLVWLMLASNAAADFSHSGSLKNLSAGARSLVDDDRYFSNLTRLRLEPRYRYQDWVLDAAYDLELVTGSFLDSPEFALLRDSPDPRYWDLQGEVHESGDVLAHHQLYRGTIQWRSSAGDFRLGRQQVNWSTALIWNPMDILNPVSPLQLEPDERIGVDALLWDTSWGATGRISAVHAPQHNDTDASTAARAKRFVAGVDVGVMVGEFAGATRAGISGSGSVAGTGWRTELVWSEADTGDSYWQGVADLNWAFRNGFNLALEYFYNGQPPPPENLNLLRLVSTRPLYTGGHYAGLLVWQDINPFWQYRVVAIRNADDTSWVLYPRSTWNLPLNREIYVTAGAQWFGGDDDSEYGRLEPLGLMEVQWFF
ncbi:hypothetical protein QPM17_20135 [Marinobacter sp. TBZ242]|uniref:Alginate export domain-containing protein n=1 Tax=Marinobacter azerbaijanicus TaxID=3050455 RepID=A0ABT7IH12_9GAMM|nr:hypothetical protein [Marinobacter sp. TBZ242]MDL0433456.1 hypothetical protein [Marinobacter sp. TBZ242]